MVDDNTLLERRNVVKKIVDHRGNAKIITGLGSPTYDVCLLYTSPSPRDRG